MYIPNEILTSFYDCIADTQFRDENGIIVWHKIEAHLVIWFSVEFPAPFVEGCCRSLGGYPTDTRAIY